MNNNNFTLEWIKLFNCNNFDPKLSILNKKGLYLYVYNGNINNGGNRIIYIGTACNSFRERFASQYGQFYLGLGTFFNILDDEDAYKDALCKSGKEFDQLVSIGKFWHPGLDYDPRIFNKEIMNRFNSNIDYWICPIDEEPNYDIRIVAKVLETRLQIKLNDKFKIGYGKPGLRTWLGKVEMRNRHKDYNYRYEFKSLPDVDEETKELFRTVNNF